MVLRKAMAKRRLGTAGSGREGGEPNGPAGRGPATHEVIGIWRRIRPRRAKVSERLLVVLLACAALLAQGCIRTHATHPGQPLPRQGDEIMVAGQLFHTGAPVVLWTDPGGYDAYRTDRRFAPPDKASWEETQKEHGGPATPNRYGNRAAHLSETQWALVHDQGWDLATLRQVVDQFVIHYDVAGTSRNCFRVLQDVRGLSVHFMIDLDGTIYQTLDVKERAWHATISNDRSVGVEIANIGAYSEKEKPPFDRWYDKDAAGRTFIHVPEGSGGVRTPGFIGHPARNELVRGEVQGAQLTMYDFTPQQYDSLIKLTATLCTVLPSIRCDYPRDAAGNLIDHKLPDDALAAYTGVLGHYHLQANKVDPGPAMQWDRVIDGARDLMSKR